MDACFDMHAARKDRQAEEAKGEGGWGGDWMVVIGFN